jgi:hypothetical protein
MSEDFWFIKAAFAVVCVAALVIDTLVPSGFVSETALAVAVLILALDVRRDRSRDFWRTL